MENERMTRPKTWSAIVATALLLSGCTITLPVSVTRFHDETIARNGTISIVSADSQEAGGLEFRATANAVSSALTRLGFQVVNDGAAGNFRAVIDQQRNILPPGLQRHSPVSVGVGGATGSYGSGLGVGLAINLSGKPKPTVTTQLRVQIRRANDDKTIWEGRAETSAKEGSPEAQPGAMSARLAEALFRDYPGASGQTVTVQ
jgi:hypothetical protein